jgi:hypothetical protein
MDVGTMSTKRTVVLLGELQRRTAMSYVSTAPLGMVMTLKEPSRTLEQNAAQWPYLDAFSKQLQWPVNGRLCTLSDEEWKDVLTAAFQGETVRLAMGLNGGVVMLGLRTSKMGKGTFSEWLEFLKATAAQRGVTVYTDEEVAA